jgi:hypothetical protein
MSDMYEQQLRLAFLLRLLPVYTIYLCHLLYHQGNK